MTKLPPILKQSLCGSKREKTLPTSAHVKRERNWTLLKRLKRGSSGRPFYFSRSRCSGLPADLPIYRPRPPRSASIPHGNGRPPTMQAHPHHPRHSIQFNPPLRNEASYEKSGDYPILARARQPARRPRRCLTRCLFYPRPLHGARLDRVPPVLFYSAYAQCDNGPMDHAPSLPPVRRRLTFSDYMRADGADRKLKECFGDPSSQRKGGK